MQLYGNRHKLWNADFSLLKKKPVYSVKQKNPEFQFILSDIQSQSSNFAEILRQKMMFWKFYYAIELIWPVQ